MSGAFVLLDVEGTTTPVDFVFRVLFPLAHARVGEFLEAHPSDPELARAVAALHDQHARDAAAALHPPGGDGSGRVSPATCAG